MRVILDSNVIIAAFSSRGLCNSLFEVCIEKYSIIISDHILDEVKEILLHKFKMPEGSVTKIIEYLKEFCIIRKYNPLPENVSRDKDDDLILALGASNDVEYIITGDNDLLALESYNSIKIISPRGFGEIARKNDNI